MTDAAPTFDDDADHVLLPVGVESEGARFRHVVIDELTGIDEELASNKKKTGGNPSKAMTQVLARAIQAIEGVIDQKKNADSQIDRPTVRSMYQADRDYLIARIHMLADKDEVPLRGQCARCEELFDDTVLLSERPVRMWDVDKPTQLEFELPRGYVDKRDATGAVHKKGIIKFPRGSHQEAVASIAKTNQAQAMTALLASCMTKLGDLEHIDQDIVRRMRSTDRRYLFKLIRDEMPGMKMWEDAECQECGSPMEVTVSLAGFFD